MQINLQSFHLTGKNAKCFYKELNTRQSIDNNTSSYNSRNTILKINQTKQILFTRDLLGPCLDLSSVELNNTRPPFKHIYISNILFFLSTLFKIHQLMRYTFITCTSIVLADHNPPFSRAV